MAWGLRGLDVISRLSLSTRGQNVDLVALSTHRGISLCHLVVSLCHVVHSSFRLVFFTRWFFLSSFNSCPPSTLRVVFQLVASGIFYSSQARPHVTGHRSLFYQYRKYPKHPQNLTLGLIRPRQKFLGLRLAFMNA